MSKSTTSNFKKMCPKVILEGTRLTHKTDIAFALNEHDDFVGPKKYRYHSPLISGEWCTFTNFPWGRGLINFEKEEEELAMETYRTWVKLFELNRYYSWTIDRFHLSTAMFQSQEYGREYDFSWLEERMNPLGFRLIFCTRTPESFAEAKKERLKVSGNPSQYDDLTRFVKEQEELIRRVEASILPTLVVDISDDDVDAACTRITKWLDETGGMYLES